MTADENKALIRDAFNAWRDGDGDFFHLLADDVRWTITGSSPIAKTYDSRRAFLDGAIKPLSERLAESIRPTVQSIVAEDDTVVVLWEGQATALDGRPYDNTYCWFLRLARGRVLEATAFFDGQLLTDLWGVGGRRA